MIRDLFAEWGNHCILCGQSFALDDPPTLEHIRPNPKRGNYIDRLLKLANEIQITYDEIGHEAGIEHRRTDITKK